MGYRSAGPGVMAHTLLGGRRAVSACVPRPYRENTSAEEYCKDKKPNLLGSLGLCFESGKKIRREGRRVIKRTPFLGMAGGSQR